MTPLLPAGMAVTKELSDALRAGVAPRSSDPTLWQGIIALTRNEPDKAIRILRHTGNPKALGVAYHMARQYVLFRQQMDEAIRIHPDDFGPYYYLGRYYDTEVNNTEEAVAWFRKALAKNPDYLPAWSYLGSCLERLGNTAEAEQAYNRSSSLAQSQTGLARLRFTNGNPTIALPFAEKAIALNPRDPAGQNLIARIYDALQRPVDALHALEAAASLSPNEASIRYQLHRAYRSLGNNTKAEEALREFERLRSIYGLQSQ